MHTYNLDETKYTITIYAVQNKETGKIVNYKNNKFYTTGRQAAEVRRLLGKPNLRLVKCSFSNELFRWKPLRM